MSTNIFERLPNSSKFANVSIKVKLTYDFGLTKTITVRVKKAAR